MEAEGELEVQGIRAGLRLLSRVQHRTFKVCLPQMEPLWSWRHVRNEKWMFHLQKNGHFKQWKLGEEPVTSPSPETLHE